MFGAERLAASGGLAHMLPARRGDQDASAQGSPHPQGQNKALQWKVPEGLPWGAGSSEPLSAFLGLTAGGSGNKEGNKGEETREDRRKAASVLDARLEGEVKTTRLQNSTR